MRRRLRSPNFTARNGVGVGEDAAHLGTQRRFSPKKGLPVSDTATCRFRTFVVAKKISTVCQHRQALPGNVVDSDAIPGRFSVSLGIYAPR
jgi:hypothetical protein